MSIMRAPAPQRALAGEQAEQRTHAEQGRQTQGDHHRDRAPAGPEQERDQWYQRPRG